MKRVLQIFGMGAVVVAGLAGRPVLAGGPRMPLPPQTQPALDTKVEINNFSFAPSTVTVPVGTRVIWTNKDEIQHNIVTGDKTVKSKLLDTNETFTFTFTKAGTYSYICTVHPRMKGTIVVQ
jgi:plastocyanin